MKKLLVLLLCAMLLPILPAMAETEELPLFRLTTFDERGEEVNMGSAVLFLEKSTLLTSAPVADMDVAAAYAADGTAYLVTSIRRMDSGFSFLTLDREADAAPASLSFAGDASYWLVGVTRNGLRYSAPAMNVAAVSYDHLDALLVSASEELLPGAVLVDEEGVLAGVTAAVWGEGVARYVALTNVSLMAALASPAENVQVNSGDSPWLQDVALSYEAGILTIDWSGNSFSDLNDDSGFIVYVEDDGNPYYSYYVLDGDRFSSQMLPVPGRTYSFWVGHTHGEDERYSMPVTADAATFTVPEEGAYEAYGFTSECWLSACGINETPDPVGTLEPLEEITAKSLSDISQSLYIMVINTYDVEEDIEASMIFSLHTPEGYVFSSASGYIFSPEYEARDAWNADVTDLFADYLSYGGGSFAPGEYELRYAIDGLWGDTFTFVLE